MIAYHKLIQSQLPRKFDESPPLKVESGISDIYGSYWSPKMKTAIPSFRDFRLAKREGAVDTLIENLENDQAAPKWSQSIHGVLKNQSYILKNTLLLDWSRLLESHNSIDRNFGEEARDMSTRVNQLGKWIGDSLAPNTAFYFNVKEELEEMMEKRIKPTDSQPNVLFLLSVFLDQINKTTPERVLNQFKSDDKGSLILYRPFWEFRPSLKAN